MNYLAECTKTGKRISMNRLLLAEDSKWTNIVYNFDDFTGPKIEIITHDKDALAGDKGHSYVYPRSLGHNHHTRGAEELNDYRDDKAKLLIGKKILIKERFSKSGRIVKVTDCVYRNDGIDLDYYFWEIDYAYTNEYVSEFAPKKEKKREKKKDTDSIIAVPCFICALIIVLTVILGILTTFWGAARLSSLAFFACSTIANFIVLAIEIQCLLRLDKLDESGKVSNIISTSLDED